LNFTEPKTYVSKNKENLLIRKKRISKRGTKSKNIQRIGNALDQKNKQIQKQNDQKSGENDSTRKKYKKHSTIFHSIMIYNKSENPHF